MEHTSLLANSVMVCDGTITRFPQFGRDEVLHVSDITSQYDACYAFNNSTVAFICDQQMYVTPYTPDVIATLKEAGYVEDHFYVPFSNWDHPRDAEEKWRELREDARKACEENT